MSLTNAELGHQVKVTEPPRLWFRSWRVAPDIVFCLAAIAVAYVAYGLFYAPAIFMDDWTSVIERVIIGEAKWFDLSDSRHLLFTPFLLQYVLFGLQIPVFHALLWVLHIVMTMLLYKLTDRLPLPHAKPFAAIVALLFLVYPTNYTHMWLIMLGVSCGIVLTLMYGYLLLRYAEGGRWPLLVVAQICLLASLGLYEAQVGVATLWAFVLVLLYRQQTWSRRLSILMPIVLIVLFSLWRTLGYQATGVEDQYLNKMLLTPEIVLSRLQLGYKITLLWGWTYTLSHFLPWFAEAKVAALALMLITVAPWWLALLIGNARGADRDNRVSRPPHQGRTMRSYALTGVVGLMLVGAGYVPTLLVYLPSLAGIGSRFNIYASIGGSVAIGALLMMGSLYCAHNVHQVKRLALATLLPLLLVGIVTQSTVQYHNRAAWVEQQTIWQQLFVMAPDLEDHTTVLFVLPGYEERIGFQSWRRTPLTASWEASSALHLLYGNFTLFGDVYFPDADRLIEPELTTDGVLIKETGRVSPYAQTVAVVFADKSTTLQLLQELPAAWIEGAESPMPLCLDCIVSNQDVQIERAYRHLVQ